MEITPLHRLSRPNTPRSPTSPRAQSPTLERMEEKRAMNELNGRLETYIQRVQDLGSANDDLKKRLDDALLSPSAPNRRLFEDQIDQLRQEVEANQRGKAMLERDLGKRNEELARERREKDDLTRELRKMEDQKIALEQRFPDLEGQLAFLNRLLDEERLAAAQKLREKDAELENLRSGGTIDFSKKLDKEREEWRKRGEDERRELLAAHAEALRQLEEDKAALEVENSNLRVQNSSLAAEAEVFHNRFGELQQVNKTLQSQVEKLASDRDLDRLRSDNAAKAKAEEVSKLRAELSVMKSEFVDLSNAKFALDTEIQAYRQLLAVGEARLGLSPSANAKASIGYSSAYSSPSQGSSSSTRKRLAESEIFSPNKVRKPLEPGENDSAAGFPYRFVNSKRGIVNIEELNPQDQYIRISNMTSSDITLSNWWIQIGLSAGIGTRDVQPKRFKFPAESILPAEDSIKVLVKITDGEQEDKGERGEAISFSSSLIQVGAFIQLFNESDELISQVDLKEGEKRDEGAFDRVCALM